jgi:hypothetical protein
MVLKCFLDCWEELGVQLLLTHSILLSQSLRNKWSEEIENLEEVEGEKN